MAARWLKNYAVIVACAEHTVTKNPEIAYSSGLLHAKMSSCAVLLGRRKPLILQLLQLT